MQVARGSQRAGGPSLPVEGPQSIASRALGKVVSPLKRTGWAVPLGEPVVGEVPAVAQVFSHTHTLSLSFRLFSLAEMTPISGARRQGRAVPSDHRKTSPRGGPGGWGARGRGLEREKRWGEGCVNRPFCQSGYYPPRRVADTWDWEVRVSQFQMSTCVY